MIIKKTITYIFEPSEYDAAEVFRNTADPFEWEEDIENSFPNVRFTKENAFYVSDSIDFFSEIIKG